MQHRVLSLAKELRDAGCGKDKVVAIYMDPSPNYVVGMLAALTAGGAVRSSFSMIKYTFHQFHFTQHIIVILFMDH